MSAGPSTVVLLCGNALQSPRKLLEGPNRLVVETRDPVLARHALTTMAVPLFVCDLATEGADFAALARDGLAANPGMRILLCGARAAEARARRTLADAGAEGGFLAKPFNAMAVRKTAKQALDAACAAGAGAVRPGGAPAAEIPADGGPDPEKYRILGLAGRGGTGTVYRALDRFLGIEVALKLINRGLLADPDVMKAFKDEARITMQLSHRNILRLYSFQENRGTPYIVMELVRGTALRDVILGNGALSAATTCQIVVQCASALGYAHLNNVVHKDIKPENIYIDETGSLKIIDFGSAVLNDAFAQSGDIVGTPEYMCPEQLRGDPVGPGADIYALGVMTYLMLVGCFPFPPDTTVQGLLSGIRPDFSALSPALAGVLARATAYDPSLRYASVEEFARDVVAACGCEAAVSDPFAPIVIIPAQLPPPTAPSAPPPPGNPPAAVATDTVVVPFHAADPEPEPAADGPDYGGEPPDDPTAPNYDDPPEDPTVPDYDNPPDDPTAPDYGDPPDDPTAPDYGDSQGY